MAKSLFEQDENAIVNAWNGGERSMNVLYKLVKPKGMLSKSHIAYIIWEHFPLTAGELVA